MIDFGRCSCGGCLVPVWNVWIDGDKKIRGIDFLCCEECFRNYPAPSEYDEVVAL